MFRRVVLYLVALVLAGPLPAARFLFDATKAETAGNADWIVSGVNGVAQRYPSPTPAAITATTPESYWTGALSAWGIALVQRGHSVESLPIGTAITYGNAANAQDLTRYDVFVIPEPNILFTATERDAIVRFVADGGSLFVIGNHSGSDRNNDGYDPVTIWNDLLQNNSVAPGGFGFVFNAVNISTTTTTVATDAGNPLTRGAEGDVSRLKYSNGATMTIDPLVNPTIRSVAWNGSAANNRVMFAYGSFGFGRFAAVGDSSPSDDGTGTPGNTLFPGWTEVSGDHARMYLNASAWLAAARTPFDVWRTNAFGAGFANATLSAATADPDRDGTSNFLEYALDLDPQKSDAPLLPRATRSGAAVQLAYPRARAELTYVVEASLDAQTWTTIGVIQGTGAVGSTVTASYTPANGQQALLRLRVTQP